VFDIAYSANSNHKVKKIVIRMQTLRTDLFHNELSYLSMNIIYASIQLSYTPDRDRKEPRGFLPPTPPGTRITYHGGSVLAPLFQQIAS